MDSVWASIREALSHSVSEGNFRIWIDPLQPLRIEGETLYLGCPNRFFLSWVREYYHRHLSSALERLIGSRVKSVDFEIAPVPVKKPEPDPPAPRQAELPSLEVHRRFPLRFNRRFTFDRFVVGDANQYAFSAAQALAQGREINAESLYLLSAPGLGKSHLSQAVGQQVLHRNGRSVVYYLTTEDFTNELVYSIKNRCVEDFKNKYRRDCDVMVLEEVHFLSGKDKVQAELCYTLDALFENGKKVVFTSSRLPKDIPRLGRQLTSRLNNSLISTIAPPGFMTRFEIIERKAREDGLALPLEVAEYMADRLTRDVRQIESGLRSLGAKSQLLNRPIDLALAQETLEDLVEDTTSLNIEAIQQQVSRYYKVTIEDMCSRSRRKEIVLPRNVGMYLSRKLTDHSLETIGKAFGRNHSTVLYSVNLIENRSRRDPKLKGQVEFLTRQMGTNLNP
ncbi:MAG: chromosomal replication initiator protein DnaA [Thermodesulfobacteriota bacterium]